MGINSFAFTDAKPNLNDFWDLYETTKWNEEYNFTLADIEVILSNIWYSLSVFDDKVLVGFGGIISDGIQHALIVNMIIHPIYQNRGLGSEVLQRLVAYCKDKSIRDIQLFSIKDKHGFYHKRGFNARPSDSPGMQYQYVS